MDVRCNRCGTEYEFEDALVSARGTTVKCTNCGLQFKIYPTAPTHPIDVWLVKHSAGGESVYASLREFQRGISDGKVQLGDLLVRGDSAPRRVDSIAELEPFFRSTSASLRPSNNWESAESSRQRAVAPQLPPATYPQPALKRPTPTPPVQEIVPGPPAVATPLAPARVLLAPVAMRPPRVFISYSHDSAEHKKRVLDLATKLKSDGIDTRLDQFEPSPAAGWPRWCERQIREADFVLLVCTPHYRRAFEDDEAGGANWEGYLTTQAIYRDRSRNLRFIPVFLDRSHMEHVPTVVAGTTQYDLPRLYRALLLRLRHQPAAPFELAVQRPVKSDAQSDSELAILLKEKQATSLAGGDTRDIDRRILLRRRQLRDTDNLGSGTVLGGGRYELAAPIKSGGVATVWKAYDHESQQVVAIKILHHQHIEDKTRIERFFRGARLMATVAHPSIVKVLRRRGEEGSVYYFVMEYLQGGDLTELARRSRLAPEAIAPLLLQVGEALAHAHAARVIHRDVKPANILLDGSGRFKLTDFDLVHAADTTGGTGTGAMGTFLFAAPEVMSAPGTVDARADIYSLGMVGHYLLNGNSLPLEVLTDTRVFRDGLSWPDGLRPVLEQACEKRRDSRFGSMSQFCEALRALTSRQTG